MITGGGYAPVFQSVFRGTLCGRWPDLPVWLTLLPLMDSRGEIDMTHEAIAALTGWPIELLRQAIAALEQPDPRSRSQAEEGRRLVRLEAGRDWGWRVVNHAMYRAKASDLNQSRRQIEDGRNAEKTRRYRERQRHAPADTGKTPADTGKDTGTTDYRLQTSDKNSLPSKTRGESARAKRSTRCPPDFIPDLAVASALLPDIDAQAEAQKFRDWEFKTPRSDWAATWRNWVQRCKETGKYARARRWE